MRNISVQTMMKATEVLVTSSLHFLSPSHLFSLPSFLPSFLSKLRDFYSGGISPCRSVVCIKLLLSELSLKTKCSPSERNLSNTCDPLNWHGNESIQFLWPSVFYSLILLTYQIPIARHLDRLRDFWLWQIMLAKETVFP